MVVMVAYARRRNTPAWLLLVATAVPTLAVEAGGVGTNGYFVVLIALIVTVARGLRPAELVLVVAIVLSPFALWAARVEDYVDLGPWTWSAGLTIGCLFGAVVQRQWELIDELNRTRQQLADAAADAERQRIAREMHDVVGHSFSVVLLHLSGARTVLESDPQRAAEALRRAEEVGRRGMEDLRQTIGLMSADTRDPLPVPDLADLNALIDDYRSAGLAITSTLDTHVDDLGGAARIVTHDVVRESLTNCAKHAPHESVNVAIAVTDDTIDVRIQNDRPTTLKPSGAGAGLAGLRHRVEAIAGRFTTGPIDDTWIVQAVIPRHLHDGGRQSTRENLLRADPDLTST